MEDDSSNLSTPRHNQQKKHTWRYRQMHRGWTLWILIYTQQSMVWGKGQFVMWEALRCERELIQNWWLLTMSAKRNNVPFSKHVLHMRLKLGSSRQQKRPRGNQKRKERWRDQNFCVEHFLKLAEIIKITPLLFCFLFQGFSSCREQKSELLMGRHLWRHRSCKNPI